MPHICLITYPALTAAETDPVSVIAVRVDGRLCYCRIFQTL
jgi:uncharacterized ParB-like nuclease family protein